MATVDELPAATAAIRKRGWADFQHLIRDHRFRLFATTMAALGAGVGALAPSDAAAATRFLVAALAALGAPLLAYSIALLWSFIRAPFRQRKELIAHLARSESAPQPLMRMEAAVDVKDVFSINLGSQPKQLSVAFVRVYNAQELGGPGATAEHVTPEVKVYAPGDELVFHHKGWDVNAWRDFTTSQEEHALWLIAKQRDADGCYIIREETAKPVKRLNDGTYVAEITLRGYMPDGPIRKRFVFTSRGSGTDLSFEEER
jgi:hypothetical protein